MTARIGGLDTAQALANLSDMSGDLSPISDSEFHHRLKQAQALILQTGLDAIYLNAGTNLYYFSGIPFGASERLVGALIPAKGSIHYIAPTFERGTLEGFIHIPGEVHCWQEHESPYQLIARILNDLGCETGHVGIDESSPFFIFDGLQQAAPKVSFCSATTVTAGCRMHKSPAELALMQRAKTMTMAVHKAAASILREGISTTEVTEFIHQAHQVVGAAKGSYFCIVLFGPDSAFPHGVARPKTLEQGDMVLIDTGCELENYKSDITRSYVFGTASARQRDIWNIEKAAQAAAFNAARPGVACGRVDDAARQVLVAHGLGPDYELPGTPHRTGHGIGLDIHEWPYLVRNNTMPLAPGMCFSNEPMICVPGEFGVRLEDHFYITDSGPKWFTRPSVAIDDPFGDN
ncbi:MAG: M24 family metallopeptidase [Parahaliea sp.]